MMLDACNTFKSLIKIKRKNIDNNIFQLHSKVTVIILFGCSLILTLHELVGKPIACIPGAKIPEAVINNFCWITGKFIYEDIGEDGIDCGAGHSKGNGKVRTLKYYQWTCIVLFIQGVLCYLPKYLWKMWEMDLMASLCSKITNSFVEPDPNNKTSVKADYKSNIRDKEQWLQSLKTFFKKPSCFKKMYATKFFICEILNFINVVVQIYGMNYFLDGMFYACGFSVLHSLLAIPENRCNPLTCVFPSMAKCNFTKYGASGSIETIDALCVLPLNLVHKKMYAFLWFWFHLLIALNAVLFVYRIWSSVSTRVRYHRLHAALEFSRSEDVKTIVEHLDYADFLILCHIHSNVDYVSWIKLIKLLAQQFREHE